MPLKWLWNGECQHADVAQLVERELPKLEVAGSRPVVRLYFLVWPKLLG